MAFDHLLDHRKAEVSTVEGRRILAATDFSAVCSRAAKAADRPLPPEKEIMGVKKTGKGRRKLGQKKRRMRARIRHRKG
jgi:hypothetical protein